MIHVCARRWLARLVNELLTQAGQCARTNVQMNQNFRRLKLPNAMCHRNTSKHRHRLCLCFFVAHAVCVSIVFHHVTRQTSTHNLGYCLYKNNEKNDNYARTHIDVRYLCVFSACSSRCARGRSVLFTFDVFLKRHDFFTGHAGLARARRRDTPGSLYGHGKFDARRRSTQAACAVSVPPPAHALNVLLL